MNKQCTFFIVFLVFFLNLSSASHGQDNKSQPVVTLERAYFLALKNHEGVGIAEKEIAKNKTLPQKANSIMMPRVNIYGEYSRYDDPIEFQINIRQIALPPITTRPEEQSGFNINVVQPLYDGTWFPRTKQADQLINKSEKDFCWNSQNILIQVATIYYNILKNKNFISLTEQYLKRSREENKIAKVQFQEGAVTEDVVLGTELKISSAQTRLIAENNDLHLARKSLALMVGEISDNFDVEEPDELTQTNNDINELIALAKKRRMDYRSALSSVEAASYDVQANKARYQPSIEGSWNYYAIKNPAYDQDDNYWIAAVRLKIPLYDGGMRGSDVEASSQTLEQARLNATRLEKEIRNDIEKIFCTIETNKYILESLIKQRELARKNYEIIFSRFKNGVAGIVDLNEALDALDKVNRDIINNKYDQQVALLEQEKSTGIFLFDEINNKLSTLENN